jgi:hypothetical protein
METVRHFVASIAGNRRWSAYCRAFFVFVLACSGAGLARANEPMVVLSVHDMIFGQQAQGTASAAQEIIVSNIGTANLTIHGISIGGENGGEFAETQNCPTNPATLPPNGACQIQVVFKPRTSGDWAATLSISDDASGSPHSVTLTGHSGPAVPAVTFAPTALAFGTHHVGNSSKVQVIVLKNTGSAPLNISSAIRIDGPAGSEFHFQSIQDGCPEDSGQVAPRASCSIGIVFTPVSAGAKSAQVIVSDDAAGSPHTIPLSGAGS